MPKRFSTTFLVTVVIAILALSVYTEVSAKVCVMYVGRTCIFWSGSVEGELTADELGDIINEPKTLGFKISPRGPGLLYCKNPDDTEPRKVPLDDKIVGSVGEFGDSVTIKRGDIDHCCQSAGTALVSAVAKLNETQLGGLDKYCEDPKWEAIDFVPSEFAAEVRLIEKKSKKELDTAKFKCVLPDWETLGWEKNKPEQRPYICDPIQSQ